MPFPSTPQATSAVQMRKTCFLRFINLIGQNSSFDDVSRSAKSNYEDHDVPTPIIKIWNIMDFFLKKKNFKEFRRLISQKVELEDLSQVFQENKVRPIQ